jgi:hypothetical protein
LCTENGGVRKAAASKTMVTLLFLSN